MTNGYFRDGFDFFGGSLPLDLASTRKGRLHGPERDLLATPSDLGRWLVAAGLVKRKPAVTEGDLADARALREALYRLALARANGEPFPDRDRALLNRWASAAAPAPRLERDGVSWKSEGVPSLLAAIARTAVELLGGELGDRIRQCAAEPCATLFVDTSRSGHRKWCSMATCGNKAKVAAFRDAQRKP